MILSADHAREMFSYNRETGIVTRNPRPMRHFKNKQAHRGWHTRYLRRPVGTAHRDGYLAVSVRGKKYLLHRLIWFLETGNWPNKIDHINGVRTDNRWTNLRSVTDGDSVKNRKLPSNNKSGSVGVSWCAKTERWTARIYSERKHYNLGSFTEKSAAISARKLAEARFGFHPNHGRNA